MPSPESSDGRRIRPSFMQDEWRPGMYYHLIGKAIPGRTLFTDEHSHLYFLKHVLRFKWQAIFQIFAYCLCGNHFHVAVQTRAREDIHMELYGRPDHGLSAGDRHFLEDPDADYVKYVQTAFRGPLSGFAQHINHVEGLSGQLLIRPTLHGLTDKLGEPGLHFSRRLIAYVLLNYAKHHLAAPTDKYRWSSLHSAQFKIVDVAALYRAFGGEAAFRTYLSTYLKRWGKRFYDYEEDDFFTAITPRRFDKVAGKWVIGEWDGMEAHDGGLATR